MTTVFIYGGSGRFKGGEFDWNGPALGTTHEFMLFLAQAGESPLQEAALAQIHRFGFEQVELWEGRKIVVETLNDPKLAAFRKHYEDALKDGSSLAWYP